MALHILKGWKYGAFIGCIVGTLGLALYPIVIDPMLNTEKYKKIQEVTRKGIKQEDIQPGSKYLSLQTSSPSHYSEQKMLQVETPRKFGSTAYFYSECAHNYEALQKSNLKSIQEHQTLSQEQRHSLPI